MSDKDSVVFIGGIIEAMRCESDSRVLFDFSDGRSVAFDLDGECCSYSYFPEQSIEVLREFIGDKLESIEQVDSERTDNDGADNVVSWHGLLIRSDKRSNTVDWRNDSNGYYDGTCTITIIAKAEVTP